jgi:uncharacterized damage-inducible protein DinB
MIARMTSKLLLGFASVTVLSLATAFAQAPGGALSAGQKGFYASVKNNVIRAAEKMPEENYSFKPSDDVRSFGQLVGHVADAQYLFCSPVLGTPNPGLGIEKNKHTKAELVQALKDAVAYCDKAYDGLTDDQAPQMVKAIGRDMAKLTVLTINTGHADEHYGNMVTYLRIKGIVPPSSEPRK